MEELKFETLQFADAGDNVKVLFYRNYYFLIPKKDLESIGKFELKKNSISFDAPEKKARIKLNYLIERYINDSLTNSLNGKRTYYIHSNSGIPLIGNNAFGIVDRNTSLIEIKPNTSCNLSCIFCSVDEGLKSRRVVDYLVEREYLVQELEKIIEFKDCDVEVHINTHGEAMLYPEIVELVSDCKRLPRVKSVTMTTNATLLTEKKVDELVAAGMSRINISLNAYDQECAICLADAPYNVEHVKRIAKYIVAKIELGLSPTLVEGHNDEQIEKIIQFGVELQKINARNLRFGVQKFLKHKLGRNPIKETPWEPFFEQLKAWEKKYGVHLILSPEDYSIAKTKALPTPFRKGDIVKAEIKIPGRINKEWIAVAKDRTIAVVDCLNVKPGDIVQVKIIKSKHNIFYGTVNKGR